MRHVFETMGTTASIVAEDAPLARIEAIFAEADARYSLYRPDSELALVASGRRSLAESGPEILSSYSAAVEWRNRTDGAFNPNRPDGVVDLSGIVKAEAMRRAGLELDGSGCRDWSFVVGGDQLASGAAPDGLPWRTGIIDPHDRARLLCSVALLGSRRAIATSGSAERGDHIWLAGSTSGAEFVQVSVIADDILTADVLATAIVSGGRATLDDVCDRWPVDVLAITAAGELLATPGFRAALRHS